MWVIANFTEENNVEVVPHSWVQDKEECYWPTLPRDKLRKFIERETQPDGSSVWKKYKARIIGNIYDDLQKARQKSNLALLRSDIETDEEKKRRRIKNKKYFDEESDSSSSDVGHIGESDEEEEPSKKCKKSLWPSTNKVPEVVSSPLREPGDLPNVGLPRRSPRKLAKAATPTALGPSKKTKIVTPPPSTLIAAQESGSKTGNFEAVCIRNQNIIKNCLRQILGELASINEKLDQSQQRERNEEMIEESDLINRLPLKTVQDLNDLEEELQDKAKETEIVNFLARSGGSTMADACRRVLRSALQDEVACLFSWAGQKGKRMFSTLRLRTAIFRAVLKQFPSTKDKEIEGVTKDWLRPSKNRLLSKEKSKKRGLDEDERGE